MNVSGLKVLQLMWCILGVRRIASETTLFHNQIRIHAILNYFYLYPSQACIDQDTNILLINQQFTSYF